MKSPYNYKIRGGACAITLSMLALASTAFAQNEPAVAPDPQDQVQAAAPQDQGPVQAPPQAPPQGGGWHRIGQGQPPQQPLANQQGQMDPNYRPAPPPPRSITIKPGTFLTVRVNQTLSSDHNHVGDAFTATLARPLVVDGVVVAQRGQTIGGRVAESQKAGRVEGVSKLGIQLTDMTLVDGQQLPLQSQLITRNGPTSVGRDAAGVATTTGVGAAIGAGVNGGVGAGVGAGIGAVVGTVGVLLTRGHPTVIYPETVLTFRVEAPVTFSTERSAYAFRYVDPNDYERPYDGQGPPQRVAGPGPGVVYAPYPYYPYYYGPSYWGPSLGFYYGPRFGYYGGFRGGWRR